MSETSGDPHICEKSCDHRDQIDLSDALATIERVWVLVGKWANESPALDKQAATRSRDGDDSLTEALQNSRAYATALVAALEPT